MLETLRDAPASPFIRLPVELVVRQAGQERIDRAIGIINLLEDALKVCGQVGRLHRAHGVILDRAQVRDEREHTNRQLA